nr:MAG TPA: hypothetical protein [Caudoviricetes sp.]
MTNTRGLCRITPSTPRQQTTASEGGVGSEVNLW